MSKGKKYSSFFKEQKTFDNWRNYLNENKGIDEYYNEDVPSLENTDQVWMQMLKIKNQIKSEKTTNPRLPNFIVTLFLGDGHEGWSGPLWLLVNPAQQGGGFEVRANNGRGRGPSQTVATAPQAADALQAALAKFPTAKKGEFTVEKA